MHSAKEEDGIVVVHWYGIGELSDEELEEGGMSEHGAEDSGDEGLLGCVNEVEVSAVWRRRGEAFDATAAGWQGGRM
jgi:hypothetical protein